VGSVIYERDMLPFGTCDFHLPICASEFNLKYALCTLSNKFEALQRDQQHLVHLDNLYQKLTEDDKLPQVRDWKLAKGLPLVRTCCS
jgi:hypothetical protein